jgi:hypothetical protein
VRRRLVHRPTPSSPWREQQRWSQAVSCPDEAHRQVRSSALPQAIAGRCWPRWRVGAPEDARDREALPAAQTGDVGDPRWPAPAAVTFRSTRSAAVRPPLRATEATSRGSLPGTARARRWSLRGGRSPQARSRSNQGAVPTSRWVTVTRPPGCPWTGYSVRLPGPAGRCPARAVTVRRYRGLASGDGHTAALHRARVDPRTGASRSTMRSGLSGAGGARDGSRTRAE